jgi:hypothetical protein
MPIKVYARSNYQIPSFYPEFVTIVRDSLDQWCKASGGAVAYKFIDNRDAANLIFDYTDRPELCTSEHEAGLEGALEMLVRADDSTAGKGNVVVLVSNGPQAPFFRNKVSLKSCFLFDFLVSRCICPGVVSHTALPTGLVLSQWVA